MYRTKGITSKGQYQAIALAITVLVCAILTGACGKIMTTPLEEAGLKIGALIPLTGDLSSFGQPMPEVIGLAVDTVNQCGGVNGKPVTLVIEDSQTNPAVGAAGVTKLVKVERVAGVVGGFASSVSTAVVTVAVRHQVMLISPASTSPSFTQQAQQGEFNGYWARTIPPDTYQAGALAKLAREKGFKLVSIVVIDNEYGVGLEEQFITAFEQLGGVVVNKYQPSHYDPDATTFDNKVLLYSFGNQPEAVIAVLYPQTGSLWLKAAYEQDLLEQTTLILTDGVYSQDFPEQVGKTNEGKFLLAGAIGTVPQANGKGLLNFATVWQEQTGQEVSGFVPHTYDAAVLLMLAAEAAGVNTGAGIKSKIPEVAGGTGKEVTDVCEAMELVRQGKKINYQGASGNVDLDENGDVIGEYDTWVVEADGQLKVTGKISPD
ncbi:MAG: ABC transporter substrate-binding protein [Symploca sp. SIO2E6]|nr:ABC transporter substrate-binding protein [Symploca sp. SIO2E6]